MDEAKYDSVSGARLVALVFEGTSNITGIIHHTCVRNLRLNLEKGVWSSGIYNDIPIGSNRSLEEGHFYLGG